MLSFEDQQAIREIVAETCQQVLQQELATFAAACVHPQSMVLLEIIEAQKTLISSQKDIQRLLQDQYGDPNHGEEWRDSLRDDGD